MWARNFRVSRTILTSSILCILILNACAGNGGTSGQEDRSQIRLIKSEIQRVTPPQIETSTIDGLVEGNTAFALDLFRSLRGSPGNLFFSPYSVSLGLAMPYAGARNETERQIRETLHYIHPQEELHAAFNALDQQLGPKDANNGGEFKLNIANAIWGQDGFPIRPDFLDTIAKNYGAGMRLVDFTDTAQREQARLAINDWVSGETQGKIRELIEEGVLKESTRLVLTNAIYFYGEWQEPFLNGTKDAPFHLLDGSQVSVPMMSRRSNTLYTEGSNFQAVELLYKGDRISMVVILPADGQYEDFERSLDIDQLNEILNSLEPHDVKLYIPKFTFESEFELVDTLKEMGMQDAFDPIEADFTGIYDRDSAGGNLFISRVIHKSYVAVNEIGTEAAAATAVLAEVTSMPIGLRVDRPFIFLIRDRTTGAVVFLGRFLDPR